MVVYTTEKRSGSILSYEFDEEVSAAWVLVKEIRHIVNETCDHYQWPSFTLVLDYQCLIRMSQSTKVSLLTALPVDDR